MTLKLRYMTTADIAQVVTIDELSFDPAWSASSYAYEINESQYSHMVVLEESRLESLRGWRRWVRHLNGKSREPVVRHQLVGYGGLWRIVEEAHISTIATHPDSRGLGYGELLLAGMVRRAITLGASYVVLEVRVSNTIAKSLYDKYEFRVVGIKPNYYRSNNEDAYDMRLNLEDRGIRQRFAQRYASLQARLSFTNLYVDGQRR